MSIRTARLLLPVTALLVLVALLGRWLWPQPRTRFATPEDCVAAWAAACKEGDVPAYLDCLSGPLLDEARQRSSAGTLSDALRRLFAGVKSLGMAPAVTEADSVIVDVDLVRVDGVLRVRHRLRRTSDGWRIVAMDSPRAVQTSVRFGTHVSDVE